MKKIRKTRNNNLLMVNNNSSMKTCSYPGCDCKIFQEDKCIFHCEKTVQNKWISTNGKIDIKVYQFWGAFQRIVEEKNDSNFLFTQDYVIPRYKTGNTNGLENLEKIIFRQCTFVDEFDFTAKKTKQFSVIGSKIEKFFRVENIRLENIQEKRKNAYAAIFDSQLNNNIHLVGNTHIIIENCTLEKSGRISIWGCPKDSRIAINTINKQKKGEEPKTDGTIDIQDSSLEIIKMGNTSTNKLTFSNLRFREEGSFIVDQCKSNVLRYENISDLSKNIKFKNSVILAGLYFNNVDLSDVMFNNFDISECHCFFNKTNIVNAKLNSVFWEKRLDNKANVSIWQKIKQELKPEVNFKNKFDLNKFSTVINANDVYSANDSVDDNSIVHFEKIIPDSEFIDIITQLKINYDHSGQYDLANKFYCLEMYLRREYCTSSFNKVVYNINGFISSFGQSYIKAILVLLASSTIALTFYKGYFNTPLTALRKALSNYDGTNFILEKIIPWLNDAVGFILPFMYSEKFPFIRQGYEFICFLYIIWISIVIWHIIVSAKRINKR